MGCGCMTLKVGGRPLFLFGSQGESFLQGGVASAVGNSPDPSGPSKIKLLVRLPFERSKSSCGHSIQLGLSYDADAVCGLADSGR